MGQYSTNKSLLPRGNRAGAVAICEPGGTEQVHAIPDTGHAEILQR